MPQINYYPLITELLGLFYLKNCPSKLHSNLQYIDRNIYPNNVKYIFGKIKLIKIKNIKNKLNVLFMSSLTGIIIKKLFIAAPCISYLNIAVVVAFNSTNRFNNYGSIIIKVKKDTINNMIKSINNQLIKNKNFAYSHYVYSNILNIPFAGANIIDLIITSAPLSINEYYSIHGNQVDQIKIRFPHCSVPIYCGCVTNYDEINVSLSIRSSDISDDKIFF
jgi:hypothetical protein